jgi:hypothetical protein
LVSAVEREYDVDPPQAQQDVSKFLNDLLSVALVEVPDAMHTTQTGWPMEPDRLATAGAR